MNRLPAKQLARMIERGETTPDKVIRACVERITERDAEVKAWTQVNAFPPGKPRGPLFGVPVGVKDIIDTHDFVTEYGSRIYAGHRPRADAAVVALTRRAGGTILGKTATCEFATFVPAKTRNPHDLSRTPGGSSSGSAAAVADFMVPLAFGTQTAGSLIRPASYCGIVGYKPTYNVLPRAGMKPEADSLDTIGVYARNVEDAGFFVSCLSGLKLDERIEKPRIGAVRPSGMEPPMAEMLERAARRLEAADVPFPAFGELQEAHRAMLWYEVGHNLADEVTRFPELMDPALRERCAGGLAFDAQEYAAAKAKGARARATLEALFGDRDVLIAPAATGEAPVGAATGDVSLNVVWTLLHVPCVTVPAGRGPDNMPLGLQVIGRIGDDARTLACARWIEDKLKGGVS